MLYIPDMFYILFGCRDSNLPGSIKKQLMNSISSCSPMYTKLQQNT